jgi:hypothetical protein
MLIDFFSNNFAQAWGQIFQNSVRSRDRKQKLWHELPADCRIRIKDIVGGLQHEYWLEEKAA